MTGLLGITKIIIQQQQVNEVYSFLRNVGKQGFEGVALWAGSHDLSTFYVDTTIIPKQTTYRLNEGLHYSVNEEELHRLNVWLYQNRRSLIAQIHSHPSAAYHSETDNEFPIVAVLGGVSIVIPNFATDEISIDNWAAYRLMPKDGWKELTETATKQLIQIK